MDTSKNRMFYIIKQSAGPVKHNNSVINNDSHLLLSQPSLGLGFIVLGFVCVLEPHPPSVLSVKCNSYVNNFIFLVVQ